jgi:spore coat protein H
VTNIWAAKLSFSSADWRGITPSRVKPVQMQGPNGNIVLRNPNAKRSGLAGVIGIDYNWTTGRLDFAGHTFSNVAVRYRGNGTYINSLYGAKQSFKVDLNKFGKKQSIGRVDELNFLNSIADFSYVRDAMAQQFFRDLKVPGPRTAYAYLTLDAPQAFTNQALGLYVMMENIDGDFAADRFGTKKAPIFKPVTTELFKYLGPDWSAYEGIYDLKTSATAEQKQRVIDFAKLTTSANDETFARELPEFLDMERFAAFLAGNVLLSSYDGFLANGQNYYLYLDPRSNKFGFIPWDQDHSWGEFGYVGSAETRENASIWHPASYNFEFLERVLKVEGFRSLYREALEKAVEREFTPEHLYPQIDELAERIRPAINAENGFRAKRFELSVSTNWVNGPRDGAPEGPRSPVHQIKRFIQNRMTAVRAQLEGRSEGARLQRMH